MQPDPPQTRRWPEPDADGCGNTKGRRRCPRHRRLDGLRPGRLDQPSPPSHGQAHVDPECLRRVGGCRWNDTDGRDGREPPTTRERYPQTWPGNDRRRWGLLVDDQRCCAATAPCEQVAAGPQPVGLRWPRWRLDHGLWPWRLNGLAAADQVAGPPEP